MLMQVWLGNIISPGRGVSWYLEEVLMSEFALASELAPASFCKEKAPLPLSRFLG